MPDSTVRGVRARLRLIDFPCSVDPAVEFVQQRLNKVVADYDRKCRRKKFAMKIGVRLVFGLTAASTLILVCSSLGVWDRVQQLSMSWVPWVNLSTPIFRQPTDVSVLLMAIAGLLSVYVNAKGHSRMWTRYGLCLTELHAIAARFEYEIRALITRGYRADPPPPASSGNTSPPPAPDPGNSGGGSSALRVKLTDEALACARASLEQALKVVSVERDAWATATQRNFQAVFDAATIDRREAPNG